LLNYESKYIKDGVLINKLNIKNQDELDRIERLQTSFILARMCMDNNSSNIEFSVSYYLNIHKDIFEDIYPFAGKIREEVIAKRIPFCLPQNIYGYLQETLKKAWKLSRNVTSYDKLLKVVVEIYSDLDVIHPFREGNGRCEREFIRRYINYICHINNLSLCYLNYSKIEDRESYIKAVVKADANLDYGDLYLLFQTILEKNEKKRKNTTK